MPSHVLSGIANIFAGIWWHKDLPYPQVEAFVQEHKKKYQREPDSWYAATAYDGFRALAASIESGGSLDRTAVRNGLRKVRLTDSLLPGQTLQFPENGWSWPPSSSSRTSRGTKWTSSTRRTLVRARWSAASRGNAAWDSTTC